MRTALTIILATMLVAVGNSQKPKDSVELPKFEKEKSAAQQKAVLKTLEVLEDSISVIKKQIDSSIRIIDNSIKVIEDANKIADKNGKQLDYLIKVVIINKKRLNTDSTPIPHRRPDSLMLDMPVIKYSKPVKN